MNNILTNWKYNDQIILTTKEIDYHCGIDSVKVERLENEAIITLTPKHPEKENPKSFSIKLQSGINKVEVWTANGKYHQHDILLE